MARWPIGLAVVAARSATGLVRPAPNLEPENGRKVVEPIVAAADLDVGRQRQDPMSPVCPPRDQNVTDDTTNSTAGDENPRALSPNSVQLVEESLVTANSTELTTARPGSVGLQVEIRWRGN